MKKSLLSLMLMLTMGISGAWADATTLYEKALTGDNAWAEADITTTSGTVGAWYSVKGATPTADATNGLYFAAARGSRSALLTYAPTSNSIQTIDAVFSNLLNSGSTAGAENYNYSYLNIGSGIQIISNQQDQWGKVIINGTENSISNCNSKSNGNRSGDLWTIHAVINTATNTLTEFTLTGKIGTKVASFTLSEAKSLGAATCNTIEIGTHRAAGTPAVALNSITIAEEQQAVTTANYTVKFLDGDGNAVKDEETHKGAVGNAISLGATDTEDFYTADNTKKYIFDSDDAEGKTIASDGSTVVTVKFHESATYNWTAKTSTGLALGSGTCFEKEAQSVGYPLYQNVEGTLYTKASNGGNYTATFTPDKDNYEFVLEYTATDITNVVYFSEGEDITGATSTQQGNMTIRSSNKYCGYAESDITLINLPAGVYKAYSVAYSNSSAGTTVKFQVGDQDAIANTVSGSSNWYGFTNEFTLSEAADFKWLTSGNYKNGLDFIYIQKVEDLNYTKTLGTTGYGTFSATVPVTVPAGVKVYSTTLDGTTLTATSIDDATVIPANTGVIFYGTPSTEYTFTATTEAGSAITTALTAAPNGVTGDGSTIYGLLKNSVEFAIVNSTVTLAANSAYLVVPAGAKAINVVFDDEATGINNVNATAVNNAVRYNLAGQRVNANAKGIVIMNGKKMMNK